MMKTDVKVSRYHYDIMICASLPLLIFLNVKIDARSHRHGTSSHDDSDGLSTSSTSTRRVSRRRSFFTASSASPTARRSVRLLHDQNRNVVESIRMTIVNMMTEIYAGMTSLLSQHHQNTVEAEMLKNIQDPSFSIKYLLHLELSKSCYDDLLEDENVARELDEIFRDEEVAKGFLAYIGRNKVDYLKKLLKDRK